MIAALERHCSFSPSTAPRRTEMVTCKGKGQRADLRNDLFAFFAQRNCEASRDGAFEAIFVDASGSR